VVAAVFEIAVVEVYFAILEFQMLVQAFPDLKKKKKEEERLGKSKELDITLS